jgi:F-type H+-transporting ATPase subunit epsilon
MASKLHFDLVSPERLLMSAEVEMVTVPGVEGDFGVLAAHAPVITTLRPGVLVVKETGGEEQRIFVRGGFAEVNLDGLTVLAEEARPIAELDAAALDQEVKDAEEDVADARDEGARQKAQETLDRLKELRVALMHA